MEKIDLSQFREKFVQEARDRISRMNGLLVSVEKTPDDPRLESDLLREAHTLKGAAKMMGYARISELSHAFEETLARRREKKSPLSRDLSDALFLGLDALSRLVESLGHDQAEAVDIGTAIGRLRLAQAPLEEQGGTEPRAGSAGAFAPPAVYRPAAAPFPGAGDAPPVPLGDGGRSIRVEPEKLERLANLVTAAVGRQLRRSELRVRMADMGRRYRRIAVELSSYVQDGIAQGAVSREFEAGILPLIERGKKVFGEIGTQLAELRRREDEESTALSQALEDIRTDILAIRMIPLSPLFESFHRSVRDLSRQLGKDVDLIVRGGKTEIDRKVAEALTDPLIHLIRNAVDHGIETPKVRAEGNKPPRGRIVLTATPKKGRVVIEVEDDGCGIDIQEVREAAIRRGLITEKAVYRLDDREILAFLFRPGFTTAAAVTEISGRGIGLDVVRTTAERFNGTVDVFTDAGKGTRVVLEMPFTMAVSRVLLFRAADGFYGIPLMHSEGIIRFRESEIATVEGKNVLHLEDAPVPVVVLSHLLGAPRSSRREESLAVLIRHSQRRMALVIDRVEGEIEVVVKDLGPYLGKIPLFMGSTILSSGEIALLLDVHDLVSAVRLHPGASSPGEKGGDAVRGNILVVDESLLSREMEERVLASGGYLVETVPDVTAALRVLAGRPFDLIVAAARRPGSEGVDLVSRIRENERSRDIPVVFVASREHAGDRVRILASGAQEWVDREDFRLARRAPVCARYLSGGKR